MWHCIIPSWHWASSECYWSEVRSRGGHSIEWIFGILSSLKLYWFIQPKYTDMNSVQVFQPFCRAVPELCHLDPWVPLNSSWQSKETNKTQITLLHLLLRRQVWQTGEWVFTHAKKLFRCRGSNCTCPTFYATPPLLLWQYEVLLRKAGSTEAGLKLGPFKMTPVSYKPAIRSWFGGFWTGFPLHTDWENALLMITPVNPRIYKCYLQCRKHELILILSCNWFFFDKMLSRRC